MKVRFSVLIPVYNQKRYVRQAIDSVLSQTFADCELLVVDDGSTDGSAELLKSYGTRIRLIQQNNQGSERARNNAAALANGEYLVMLDHDDCLFPNALSTYDHIIRAFDSPPLIIGCMTNIRNGEALPTGAGMSGAAEVLKYTDYLSKETGISLSNSRIVVRKSTFDEVGGYTNQGVAAFPPDDFNLILKLGTFGPCVVVTKPYTVAYREHAASTQRNVEAVADGIRRLTWFENQGRYPGGKERRWARYATLGGFSANWAFRRCWQGGHRRLAVRLLLATSPMVCAAVWKRLLRPFRKPAQPITLPAFDSAPHPVELRQAA
jgi:glycosyltransferase involved in cell wall biosynthesis